MRRRALFCLSLLMAPRRTAVARGAHPVLAARAGQEFEFRLRPLPPGVEDPLRGCAEGMRALQSAWDALLRTSPTMHSVAMRKASVAAVPFRNPHRSIAASVMANSASWSVSVSMPLMRSIPMRLPSAAMSAAFISSDFSSSCFRATSNSAKAGGMSSTESSMGGAPTPMVAKPGRGRKDPARAGEA